MLKVDNTLNHIPAGRNHVIGLHESINQPLVNIPSFGTAPTAAFILGTRNDQGAYTVFVYLHQPETRAVVVYVSEPRLMAHEQYRVEEAEAIRFVESMGFMVDNLHFPTLAPPEQESVMQRIPLFRPPQQTLDLYDVQEDMGASSAPPAAIFGGLSAADSALVRGAATPVHGVPIQGAPLTTNHGAPVPITQGSPITQGGPVVGAPVVGTPTSPPAGGIPPMALRHSALHDARGPDGGLTGEYGVPRTAHTSPDMTAMPPGFVAAPTQAGQLTTAPADATTQPPRPDPDPDALRRLGRLLGTFVWVLVGLTGVLACKSSGTEREVPSSVTAQIDLGNQQLAQGQWPDAIKSFGRALDLDQENFDALRGTGLAYLKLGRLEEAERFYRLSLEANPKSSLSRNELAVVFLEQRRCQDAVPLFEKVLEDIFYPTPEFAEHNLAQAYACLGRVDEALSRLDKLVTKRPYFCLGYLTLSRLASTSRRPESTIRACDDFAHYCEQNDKIKNQVLPQQSALCYLRKGLAYAELGDVESARASFERCKSLGEVGRECSKSLELLPR